MFLTLRKCPTGLKVINEKNDTTTVVHKVLKFKDLKILSTYIQGPTPTDPACWDTLY